MQLALRLEIDTRLPHIYASLLALYGAQRDPERHPPVVQLFKAIISSRTKDAVSDDAFQQLCAHLPSWNALADADPKIIADRIRSVKFAERKASDLIATARILRALPGRFDLCFLADWPVDAAMSWLQKLPGVGPKVAAATLNFSTLRKRAFAVDTHVMRLSERLDFLPKNTGGERAFRIMMRLMPEDWDADNLYELHWLMKMHGQRTCPHQKPACHECPLAQLCPQAIALYGS